MFTLSAFQVGFWKSWSPRDSPGAPQVPKHAFPTCREGQGGAPHFVALLQSWHTEQPPSVTGEENRYSVHRAVAAQKSLLPPFHHLRVKIASVHKWGKKHIVNQRGIKLNGRLSSVFPSLSSRALTALLDSYGKRYFSSWQHVPQRIWMKQISDSFFLHPVIPCSRRMFFRPRSSSDRDAERLAVTLRKVSPIPPLPSSTELQLFTACSALLQLPTLGWHLGRRNRLVYSRGYYQTQIYSPVLINPPWKLFPALPFLLYIKSQTRLLDE